MKRRRKGRWQRKRIRVNKIEEKIWSKRTTEEKKKEDEDTGIKEGR